VILAVRDPITDLASIQSGHAEEFQLLGLSNVGKIGVLEHMEYGLRCDHPLWNRIMIWKE